MAYRTVNPYNNEVVATFDDPLDPLWGGIVDMEMSDLAHRRGITSPHARGTHDSHLRRIGTGFERLKQSLCAFDGAGNRIADTHRGGRRWCLALLHHIEMCIEGRDLVSRGLREPDLFAERAQMAGGNIVVAVLNEMQILDEQVVTPRLIPQKLAYLLERLSIELPPLREGPSSLA